MRYRVRHLTGYRYSDPVQLCRNEACLLPRNTPHQRCLDSRLEVVPLVTEIEERRDFFDNRLHFFAIQTPHNSLSITAVSTIDVEVDQTGYALGAQIPWEQARMGLTQTGELLNSAPYMYNSPHVTASAALADYAIPSFGAGRSITDAVDELMQRIYHDFTYDPEVTNVSTPLTEVLANRHGVCQDFSHVAIGCLRSIGLAARYVSGYIETLTPPGQERLVGADASHAWFSVYVPTIGWLDFDPTNNQRPHQQHITVAWGRDFSDVSPLKGVALGGGHHEVLVSVDVARLPDNGVRSNI
ncbi:MAG: transglutaminase [Desulfuromonas sp.]|nr:MAG: transglutaminase [Desulfuromonas sp.]